MHLTPSESFLTSKWLCARLIRSNCRLGECDYNFCRSGELVISSIFQNRPGVLVYSLSSHRIIFSASRNEWSMSVWQLPYLLARAPSCMRKRERTKCTACMLTPKTTSNYIFRTIKGRPTSISARCYRLRWDTFVSREWETDAEKRIGMWHESLKTISIFYNVSHRTLDLRKIPISESKIFL